MSNSNSPDPIKKIIEEERALAVVRVLHASPLMMSNDGVLQKCVQAYGLACGYEEFRAHLGQLEREGLISSERHEDRVVVRLTQRGADAAQGLIVVDAVARPDPRGSY